MKTAKKTTRRGRRPNPGERKQPFSLILLPAELRLLRGIAKKEGSSVATVIRRAIDDMLLKKNPGLRRKLLENKIGVLVDDLAAKTGRKLNPAKRRKLVALMMNQ